jgi:hypothetical protein
MTAEGRSGNYSFTVTIPSLANKTIIVKDVTIDTTIGEYDASDSGAITFTASLDSLHTFKIAKKSSAIANMFVVDDFDSYENDGELQNVWHPNPTLVWLNTDPNFVREGNSMKYVYTNGNTTEADANTTGENKLPVDINNWTTADIKALVLYFYGDAGNTAEKMYVALRSTDNNLAVVYYDDPNDLNEPVWHEWNIKLSDFSVPGTNDVNLRSIDKVYIGFGTRGSPTTSGGTVYFEDIHLYRPRCVLSKRSADFAKVDYAPAGDPAGDCVIDYRELEIMAGNWLMTPPDPNVDLYGDGAIDFRDFAVLVDMWLEEQLWP